MIISFSWLTIPFYPQHYAKNQLVINQIFINTYQRKNRAIWHGLCVYEQEDLKRIRFSFFSSSLPGKEYYSKSDDNRLNLDANLNPLVLHPLCADNLRDHDRRRK